jgi:hypothetical protein
MGSRFSVRSFKRVPGTPWLLIGGSCSATSFMVRSLATALVVWPHPRALAGPSDPWDTLGPALVAPGVGPVRDVGAPRWSGDFIPFERCGHPGCSAPMGARMASRMGESPALVEATGGSEMVGGQASCTRRKTTCDRARGVGTS